MSENFVTLVRKMRDTQKLYFKTRNNGVLIRVKELEKKVDEQLDNFV